MQTALVNVHLPLATERIDEDAFRACTTLVGVVLSKQLNHIGRRAFYDCTSLENVSCEFTSPASVLAEDSIFGKVNTAKARLLVPSGSRRLFMTVPQWRAFAEIVENSQLSLPTTTATEAFASTIDGGLRISLVRPERIVVYTLSGRLRLSAMLPSGISTISLPKGTYLVKADDRVVKLNI